MKIVVMGAGAVGCYFGGLLARCGHEVVLIGRAQHVAAIEAHGLRVETKEFDEHIRLAAGTEARMAQGADVVLFCVKSPDTEHSGAELAPFLAPQALVLCLQNGVDNADRLRGVLPEHDVAAAVVYVATEMAGPGHVKHHGRGELVIEPSPRSASVAQAFQAAGIPVEISDNVRGALWSKLVLNCAYNALSAITQLPYGRVVQGPGVLDVIEDLIAECLAVAAADGVVLPGDVREAVRRIVETMPTQFSSTAQDLARGKPSEIDHLNGYVLRRGATLGIATPVNRVLHTLVKLLELKASAPS